MLQVLILISGAVSIIAGVVFGEFLLSVSIPPIAIMVFGLLLIIIAIFGRFPYGVPISTDPGEVQGYIEEE